MRGLRQGLIGGAQALGRGKWRRAGRRVGLAFLVGLELSLNLHIPLSPWSLGNTGESTSVLRRRPLKLSLF